MMEKTEQNHEPYSGSGNQSEQIAGGCQKPQGRRCQVFKSPFIDCVIWIFKTDRKLHLLPKTKMNCSRLMVLLSIAIVTSANTHQLNMKGMDMREIIDAYLREERHLQRSETVVVPEPKVRLMANTGCFWSGTSPFCNGFCGKGFNMIVKDKSGDGIRCWFGIKKLCCPLQGWILASMKRSPFMDSDFRAIFNEYIQFRS